MRTIEPLCLRNDSATQGPTCAGNPWRSLISSITSGRSDGSSLCTLRIGPRMLSQIAPDALQFQYQGANELEAMSARLPTVRGAPDPLQKLSQSKLDSGMHDKTPESRYRGFPKGKYSRQFTVHKVTPRFGEAFGFVCVALGSSSSWNPAAFRCAASPSYTNPRVCTGKFTMSGNTWAIDVLGTPNHWARVAAY